MSHPSAGRMIIITVLSLGIVGCGDVNVGNTPDVDAGPPGRPSLAEECNGQDDNRDGRVDEGCPCAPGEIQACFGGGYPSRGLGACEDGVQTCTAAAGIEWGDWGNSPCEGEVLPVDEMCDGRDHDCDGLRDEGCPCTVGDTVACGVEFLIEPCMAGEQRCLPNGMWDTTCEGAVGPSPEVCDNGVDDDCDGEVDDERLCECVYPPVPEVCSDAIDNDCDGVVDEPACREGVDGGVPDAGASDAGTPDAGLPGDAGPCSTSGAPRQLSPLSTSRTTSQRPTLRWELPAGGTGAVVELCGDPSCTSVRETIRVIGTEARPVAALPAGPTFWRAYAWDGSTRGCIESSVWEFFVRPTDTPTDVSWGTILDFDRDGFADFVAGDSNGNLFPYRGGSRVLAPQTTLNPASTRVFSARSAGDLNGDGYADLVVGNWGRGGTIYIYYGGAGGLRTPATAITGRPELGIRAGTAGDVNRDGYADLLVSSGDSTQVYLGGPGGVITPPLAPLSVGGRWGVHACDLQADGLPDALVGDPGATGGVMHIFSGTASGLPSRETGRITDSTRIRTDFAMATLACAGDVNGDGMADVVVGAKWQSRVYLHLGSATAPSSLDPTPAFTAMGEGSGGIGSGVARLGDVNADGFDDFGYIDKTLVGVVVVLGNASASGWTTIRLPVPADLLSGREEDALTGLGDVDGDGFDDIALAGWNGGNQVYVFFGGASGPAGAPLSVAAPAGSETTFGFFVGGGEG